MEIKIINDNGRIWCIKKIDIGEDCAEKADRPLVEFYDCRYEHTPLGQFVSRYYVHTLLDGGNEYGLRLHGGVPDWYISKKGMDRVRAFLEGGE